MEGFEDRVLGGMSFSPNGLSFEFHYALLHLVAACLSSPALNEAYRFNYMVGMNPTFECSWVNARDLESILAQDVSEAEFGDVFCKRV